MQLTLGMEIIKGDPSAVSEGRILISDNQMIYVRQNGEAVIVIRSLGGLVIQTEVRAAVLTVTLSCDRFSLTRDFALCSLILDAEKIYRLGLNQINPSRFFRRDGDVLNNFAGEP
jgi:hypothetical protein